MTENRNIWYYPRTKLARQYMDILDTGITRRLTIFSPRRTGKTNFLVNDLAKEAEQRKRIVIYMSMWDNPDAPHQWLISTLTEAIHTISRKGKLKSLLTSTIQKLKIEGVTGLAKIGAEIEFTDQPKTATSDELSQLSLLFKTLHQLAKRRNILLLLDEIQHLSTANRFDSFTHNLRTSLDIYSDKIEVVFTGSSRSGLKNLFSDTRAPLYAFSDQIEFPVLDIKFIEFMKNVFKKVTRRNLDKNKAWDIFQKLDFNPYYMRMILQAMIIQVTDDIDCCYADVKENIALQLGYPEKWKNLRSLDRIVYLAITDNLPIYAVDTLDYLSKQANKNITTGQVQKSVDRLISQNLISQIRRGEYLIENPGFKEWCLERK